MKGHFSSQCLTSTVKKVTAPANVTSSNNENLDMAFLSAVVSADKTCWTVQTTHTIQYSYRYTHAYTIQYTSVHVHMLHLPLSGLDP